MTDIISRRKMLGITAGAAAGASWVFALNGRREVVLAQSDGTAFAPTVLSPDQLEAVAALCDTLIPKTNTPGARDARVHEYIDVRLSGRYADEQQRFLTGLTWLEERSTAKYGNGISKLSDADRIALLEEISDEHDTFADDLKPGAAFFVELKGMTIHGYYTSRDGRVETLGLPDHLGMQQWVGCTHAGGEH